jgi:hypothetical protein
VLKRKQFAPSKHERRVSAAVFIAVLAVIAAVFFPLFASADWSRAWQRLVSGSLPPFEITVLLLLGAAHYWYWRRAKRLERLFLDERGMRYQSPLPEWLASRASWSHPWSEISAARVVLPRLAAHPNTAALVIEAGGARRRLPAMWVPAQDHGAEERSAQEVEDSALVRYLRRMGVKVEVAEGAPAGFALERHRASLAALALIFALLGYAIIDWMVNTETYAVKPPAVLHVLAGAIVLLACGIVLALNRVPHAESWGVSVVLGAVFAAALYPGLLRVNQLTDAEGLKPQAYRLEDYVLLKPLDSRLPDLMFIDYHEYWQQFPRGSQHEFPMRKGALGFYQVDMGPVNERMREFYRR